MRSLGGVFAGGAEARSAIWRRLLRTTVPGAAEIDWSQLGRRHELTGSQINNAVLRAAFRAAHVGGVTQRLLDEAAAEEGGASRVRTVVEFASA